MSNSIELEKREIENPRETPRSHREIRTRGKAILSLDNLSNPLEEDELNDLSGTGVYIPPKELFDEANTSSECCNLGYNSKRPLNWYPH